METLASGTTVLVYEETTGHPDNDFDVIHIRFSDDNGATWSLEDKDLNGDSIVGFPTYPDGGALDPYGPGGTYIWQAPNGDLYLHCWKVDYDATLMLGTWRKKSTDNGITWGAWEQLRITGQTDAEDNLTAFEESHFIYNGDIYAVCRVYGNANQSSCKGIFIKSTDNGTTWTKISDISTYTDETHEFAMEYLGENKILLIVRDLDHYNTFRITSDDFGVTWNPIVGIASSIDIVGRPRMFTLSHLKGEANWWTDTKLIMEGFVHINPGSSQGRRNAIWLSEDAGYSWTKPIYLDDADVDAGYGDLIYDSVTDTYRVVTYKGNLAEANLIQYDFKVNW